MDRKPPVWFDSVRKTRLLLCAAFRQALPVLAPAVEPEVRAAVEATEAYADGRQCDADMAGVRDRWRAAARAAGGDPGHASALARLALTTLADFVPQAVPAEASRGYAFDARNILCVADGYLELIAWERSALPGVSVWALAADVEPVRPALDPAWRTDTAVALAAHMYESRDFSAMPILADALQDAGCGDEAVLAHCRDAAAHHTRGCWVVDSILGKE